MSRLKSFDERNLGGGFNGQPHLLGNGRMENVHQQENQSGAERPVQGIAEAGVQPLSVADYRNPNENQSLIRLLLALVGVLRSRTVGHSATDHPARGPPPLTPVAIFNPF
jgi:hypothetical protein